MLLQATYNHLQVLLLTYIPGDMHRYTCGRRNFHNDCTYRSRKHRQSRNIQKYIGLYDD